MRVVIVPGYGDRSDYLERAAQNWGERFGLEPEIVVFGWNGVGKSYDEKWNRFSQTIQEMGEVAIIGISAGASAAVRALQTHPDLVKKVITICGPVHKSLMNPKTLHNEYPVLEQSLERLTLKNLPSERVMTLRPLYDNVVDIEAMRIDGAHDKRMLVTHHTFSIVWAMYINANRMAKFINS